MPKVRKILAPTDFSELSKLGLRYALETALDESAEVIVYHVIDFSGDWTNRQPELKPYRDMLENSRQALDRFLNKNFAKSINQVKVRQVVEFGAPYQNIVEKAASEGVDRIVMSTHGRTGIDNFLLGSVAQKVVAHACCPVLVVPRCAGEGATAKAAGAPAWSRSGAEFPGEDVGLPSAGAKIMSVERVLEPADRKDVVKDSLHWWVACPITRRLAKAEIATWSPQFNVRMFEITDCSFWAEKDCCQQRCIHKTVFKDG